MKVADKAMPFHPRGQNKVTRLQWICLFKTICGPGMISMKQERGMKCVVALAILHFTQSMGNMFLAQSPELLNHYA